MDPIYEKIIRPVFFRQDPEAVHALAVKALRMLGAFAPLRSAMEKFNLVRDENPVKVFGVEFPNRVGLAAGFDKDALAFRAAAALGFGHVEIGTVTMHKQSGNPKPRVFRYPQDEALVNYFGFPNEGAENIAHTLSKTFDKKTKKIPLGVNIGKSKITPLEEAAKDYVFSYNALADYADYFAINVSCPNLPDVRKLQLGENLRELLNALKAADAERASKLGKAKIPMLLKISPDLTFREIDSILETVFDLGVDGIIATNTTSTRPESMAGYAEKIGGLSGKPIFEKSLQAVKYVCAQSGGKIPVIGVGGIYNTECAAKMLDEGASLVQIYTAFIYNGPFFAKELAKSLHWRNNPEWI